MIGWGTRRRSREVHLSIQSLAPGTPPTPHQIPQPVRRSVLKHLRLLSCVLLQPEPDKGGWDRSNRDKVRTPSSHSCRILLPGKQLSVQGAQNIPSANRVIVLEAALPWLEKEAEHGGNPPAGVECVPHNSSIRSQCQNTERGEFYRWFEGYGDSSMVVHEGARHSLQHKNKHF